MDKYLETTRIPREEKELRSEITRMRNSFSFRFGILFAQAIERPILLPILPITITKFLLRCLFEKKQIINLQEEPTRNCVIGFSAESSRGLHFERMERILSELRQHGIQTVHVTNDREIRIYDDKNGSILYSIPARGQIEEMNPRTWNKKCNRILSGILDTYHPRSFLFDGDYPFRGVLNAITVRPEMNTFWLRESPLNFKIPSLPIDGFDAFDAIIHPSISRRDDPDSIIGNSGTIFCNPIMGKHPNKTKIEALHNKYNTKGKKVIFVQISKHILEYESIFQQLLLHKDIVLLCLSPSTPKQFKHNKQIIYSHTLTTNEAISLSDACLISPDFHNIHSCFFMNKPTICIVDTKTHLDSIYREFGTKNLPLILIESLTDDDFISISLERILNEELQMQLIERMKEITITDGTKELCSLISELHSTNLPQEVQDD